MKEIESTSTLIDSMKIEKQLDRVRKIMQPTNRETL